MTLRTAVSTVFLLTTMTVGAGLLPATGSPNQPAQAALEGYARNVLQEASNLLVQVHSLGQHLKDDAATLESLNQSTHGRRSHGHALNEIRDGIGSMGGLLGRLLQIRDEVLPWKQQAIDRISPSLENLATRTEAALLQLEGARYGLSLSEYQNHLSAIAQEASEVHELLGTHLAYTEGQQRLDRLMRFFEKES